MTVEIPYLWRNPKSRKLEELIEAYETEITRLKAEIKNLTMRLDTMRLG